MKQVEGPNDEWVGPARRRCMELELLRAELNSAVRDLYVLLKAPSSGAWAALQRLERGVVRFATRVDQVASGREESLRLEGERLRTKLRQLASQAAVSHRSAFTATSLPTHPQLLIERNTAKCEHALRALSRFPT